MPTPADFLKSLGESLARYERPRVAKIGCGTALALLALLIVAAAAGLVPATPIFPRFFRLVTIVVLGGILAVFLLFALLETASEKAATRRVREFIASGGADLATLLEMARTRKGRYAGSEQVLAVLERLESGTPAGS